MASIREPFIPWAKAANDPLISLGYTAIITLLTIITRQLFFWFERYLKNKFLKKTPQNARFFKLISYNTYYLAAGCT